MYLKNKCAYTTVVCGTVGVGEGGQRWISRGGIRRRMGGAGRTSASREAFAAQHRGSRRRPHRARPRPRGARGGGALSWTSQAQKGRTSRTEFTGEAGGRDRWRRATPRNCPYSEHRTAGNAGVSPTSKEERGGVGGARHSPQLLTHRPAGHNVLIKFSNALSPLAHDIVPTAVAYEVPAVVT